MTLIECDVLYKELIAQCEGLKGNCVAKGKPIFQSILSFVCILTPWQSWDFGEAQMRRSYLVTRDWSYCWTQYLNLTE